MALSSEKRVDLGLDGGGSTSIGNVRAGFAIQPRDFLGNVLAQPLSIIGFTGFLDLMRFLLRLEFLHNVFTRSPISAR